jgi:AraC family transcriptional regulator
MEILLARTDVADVFLLKHGSEPPNVAPRESACAFRGIHFLEEHPFVLGFNKSEWLLEEGSVFLTEPGRLHKYSHLQGMPADTVMSVRFRQPLLDCMNSELAGVPFARLQSFVGLRNDLRFLRWRWTRLPQECRDFAVDEWVVDLIAATYRRTPRSDSKALRGARLAWYAERIDAAREQLASRFAEQHLLLPLARSVGMSPFHFARVFRELTGAAPHQYLLRVRYSAALRMLLDGASVTEACFSSGFSNLSHFTREFHKRFGRRPSAVKKSIYGCSETPSLPSSLCRARSTFASCDLDRRARW